MDSPDLAELMSHNQLKVGTFVCEFATPGIGHILKGAGCDYAFFDMEHSGIDVGTMKSVVRYFEAADLPMLVRPAAKDYYAMARLLDIGVEGLILPMVGSAEEASQIVQNVKYTPQGERGVALAVGHDRYRHGPVMEKLANANRTTKIWALIETKEGINEVEAIAAVDGIDGLWLGHFDLSCSLNIPGEFDNPLFIDAVSRTVKAAQANNKRLGRVVANVEEGKAQFNDGFDFIAVSGDVWLLQAAMATACDDLRQQTRS